MPLFDNGNISNNLIATNPKNNIEEYKDYNSLDPNTRVNIQLYNIPNINEQSTIIKNEPNIVQNINLNELNTIKI